MADGSIDQLNFEVVLKDSDFNQKLQELQQLANAFNISMTQALTISKAKTATQDFKELGKALKDAEKYQKELNEAISKMPASKLRTYLGSVQQTNSQLHNTTNIMRTLSQLTGVAFGAMGIRRFLSTLIEVTGQFEVQKMALGAMLQDADKADKIFGQFRQLALESPYTFQEFTKFGKQLTAFNIPAEKLVSTTKMLADVAAGLGVDMQRIILAYGQIKSAGVLKGMELRQLTEAGVPILDSLAKQIEQTTGKTVQLAEVFDMISKKQIPFAMVEQAFKDMTTEGGKFYNMQEVLVETLAGKIGKLKDTWQQALYDIGSAQSGLLKGSVDLLTNIVANFDKLGRAIVAVVAGYGAYKAALFVATLATKAYTAAEILLVTQLSLAEMAQKALNATMLANPYVAVTAATLLAVAALVKYAKATDYAVNSKRTLNRINSEYAASVSSERQSVRDLLERMQALNPETKKYAELKEKLLSKYGQYLSEVQKEKIAIGDLAGVYDTLSIAIGKAARARAFDEGEKDLENQLDRVVSKIKKSFDSEFGYIKSEQTKENLWDYIFGDIDESGLTEDAEKFTRQLNGSIRQWRRAYQNAFDEVKKGRQSLESAFGDRNPFVGDGGEWPLKPTDWQLKVSRRLGNGDMFSIFGFKDNENWETYYTRMVGEYRKLGEDIIHAENETTKELYKKRKEALEQLNKDFGGALLGEAIYKTSKGAKIAAQEERKEEQHIKTQISNILKLKDAYDQLAQNPLVGEDNAATLMERFYGETDLNFEERVNNLLNTLLKMNPALHEYVEGIRDAFGKDSLNEYLKSLSALDQIDEKITEYISKDFHIEGDDIAARISKALTDLFNKNIKVDIDAEKMIKDLEKAKSAITTNYLIENAASFKAAGLSEEAQRKMADDYWDEYKKRRIKEVEEQAKQEKAYNEKNTKEVVKGFADDIYKKLTESLDLTDWAHKSVAEIETIKKSLETIDLPDDIKAVIDDPDLLQALSDAVKELADADSDKADEKIREKRLKNWDKTAKKIEIATDALKQFAEASADARIAALANRLGDIVSVAGDVARAIAEGNTPGAIAAIVSYEVNSIMSVITANSELRKSIRETAEEARRQSYTDALAKGVSSIFGTNDVNKIKNAANNLQKLRKYVAEDNDPNRKMVSNKKAKWWEFLLTPTATTAWASLLTKQTNSLSAMADKLGMSLYDQYGNLNAVTLQKILDTYSDLKQADKDWIQSAINNSEAYADAMKQVDDVMESLFGDIASSATDIIVDSWIEAGNAALDYADILDDVAQAYAKMVIKSVIFDEVLNDEAIKALKEEFLKGDAEKAMALVENNLQQIADMAPIFEEILSSFDPYFVREEASSTSGNSLSSGIKSITEDTAGLLASYINAMRADLSVVRSLQMTGWQDVKAIKEAIQSQYAPNYNEYMAQIAANTYDTAQSNAEILSKIKSIITSSPTGGSAVRTTK